MKLFINQYLSIFSFLLFTLLGCMGQAQAFRGQDLSFTREEITKMAKGELLVKSLKRQGPWPELKVFALIDVEPIKAMAVFADYPAQKSYVPNIIESKVLKEPKAGEIHVKYELKTPWPLSNSHYINRHQLSGDIRAESFLLKWFQVESDSTDVSEGSMGFERRFGMTLMSYSTYIEPKSAFAGLVKNTAKENVLKTLKAIIEHTYQVSKNNNLKREIEVISRGINGMKSYPAL